MKPLKWIKDLLFVVGHFKGLCDEVKELRKLVKNSRDINVDLHRKHALVIILGRFQNRDYVEVFTTSNGDGLDSVIHNLHGLQRNGTLKRIDTICPEQLNHLKHRIDLPYVLEGRR